MRTRFVLATLVSTVVAALLFPVARVAGLRVGAGRGGTIVWDGSGDVATMNTALPTQEELENMTTEVLAVPTDLVIRLTVRVGIKQLIEPPAGDPDDPNDNGDGRIGLETLKLLLTTPAPCPSCLALCAAIPDEAKQNFPTCDDEDQDPAILVTPVDVEGLSAGPVYTDGAEFKLTPAALTQLQNGVRSRGLLAGLRLGLSVVASDEYRETGKDDEYATLQIIPLAADGASSAATGLLLQHENGQLSDWALSATRFVDHDTLRSVPPNWRLVGSGDVDRDGDADLYWHEQNEGWVAVWRMDGNRMLSGDYITPSRVPDTNWKLRTIGDLNSDGSPDLVWQNIVDERVIIWFMNGTALLNDRLMQPAMLDRNWHFVGVGDANGDGKGDLFLQHQLNGQVGVWMMNGHVNVSGGFLTPSPVPVDWRIRAVKDLDGNGRPDLLLQNVKTGALARWLMNGSSRVDEALLTPALVGHPKWRLAAVR
jgi:hypothetical protein